MASRRLAPGSHTLACAARAVARVAAGGVNADDALAPFDRQDDRAAVCAIALGTMRWYLRLRPMVGALLARSAKKLDPELHALLLAAVHQIEYSRNAPEGIVHTAVDAARALGQERATGLINAVLRRYVRERAALAQRFDAEPANRHAHPHWFVERLRAAEPERWESVLEANNAPPPMTLRVAGGRAPAYLADLAAAGIEATAVDFQPDAVVLARPVSVDALPGFAQGHVSVQDAGAQFAAVLLDARPGMRVLDACAAPGGKTCHILERAGGDLDVLAVDIDASRLERVQANLDRLGLRARLAAADLRRADALEGEAPFDRILVDVPCSATGVIRRHPDIKLLRRADDIRALADTQRTILARAFDRLAPGGRLVYCTCSVLPEENEAVVADLLERAPDARIEEIDAVLAATGSDAAWPPGAQRRGPGMQFYPAPQAGTDGFHYACLRKVPRAAGA